MKIWMLAVSTALALAAALHAADPPADPAQPTLITLHESDVPGEEALKDLFHQASFGYTPAANLPAATVNLDFEKEPFWKVATKINDALHTSMNPRNGKIEMSLGDPPRGRRCFSGPCLLVAQNVSHRAYFTEPVHQDDCVVNMQLYVEPRVNVVLYSSRLRPDLAVDEKGVSLVPAEDEPIEHGVPGFSQWVSRGDPFTRPQSYTVMSTGVALKVPEQAGRRVAQVKGALHLKVPVKTTVIEMPAEEFTRGRQIDFHEAHIAVSPVRNLRQAPDAEYAVSLNITRPGMSQDDWDALCDLLDGATMSIVDQAGVAYNQNGGGGTPGHTASNNRIISAQFQPNAFPSTTKAGPAALLRITLPDEIRDVPVPFEFKDLPLP